MSDQKAAIKGKVGIVGSGIVGRAWAVIFARGGYSVDIFDIKEDARKIALREVATMAQSLKKGGLLFGQEPSQVTSRIRDVATLREAVQGAVYVQECVPENLQLKIKVFSSIDAAVVETGNASVILASSSSNMPASKFTSGMRNKSRCLVAHPVNPPFSIPVVEVVPAPYTDAAAIADATRILKQVGMAPALLKREIDGFLVNRLQYALLSEAFRLVDDDAASPEDVDVAISKGLGLRWSFMGPFQTIDLNAPEGVLDYFERYTPMIKRLIKGFDNTRPWRQETVERIHKAMRKQYPMSAMGDRTKWRNDRLVSLAAHKLNEDAIDTGEKERAAPTPARTDAEPPTTGCKAAVIGSGIIGCSWAAIFARGGYAVDMYDIDSKAVDRAIKTVTEMIQMLSRNDLLFGQDPAKVAARVKPAVSMEAAITDADYMQENVPERLPLRKKVWAQIDEAVAKVGKPGAVLASSTSTMMPSTFTSEVKCRSQAIVAHPVNPPFAVPVIEVIPAPYTSAETKQKTVQILKDVGMAPALLKREIDGFLVNRMQYALLSEAFRLVADDVASPEDIDVAVSKGLGLRWSFMGPFQTIDLNAPGGVLDYFKRYGSGISGVIKGYDNTRPWPQETINKIDAAIRKQYPKTKMAEKLRWRNARLLNLAVLKNRRDAMDAKVPACVVGYVTVSDAKEADDLAVGLVKAKLAACVNKVPGVESVYEWEGKVEKSSEVLLVIKTQANLTQKVTDFVVRNHSYDTPEVVFTKITGGNRPYIKWVAASTRA